MQIIIHCGGMPFNGDTLKTKSLGGSESAAYYLAKELADKGHDVLMFTNHPEEGNFDGVAYNYAGEVTEKTPLGDRFSFYAVNTPHDVLIIQRGLMSFNADYASKVNILWLHDLALYRQKDQFNVQLWNVDAIFTVSEYHKQQVVDVYGLNPDIVIPITNGVDLELYDTALTFGVKLNPDPINLIYSSRPERGLEHLVKPDGIMDRLYKVSQKFKLYVCTYDNVAPHMRDFYEMLWQRCQEMPNVELMGNLSKQELADVQRQCVACVYPTQFEEVSCITAMECMAAGIQFISSEHAALPETCKGSGSTLIPLSKDGAININKFVKTIEKLDHKRLESKHSENSERQLAKASDYSWVNACDLALNHIDKVIERNYDNTATAKQLMHNSDIYNLKAFTEYLEDNPIVSMLKEELSECYAFTEEDDWGDHYAKYYEYEKERGVNYGPEDLTHNDRFRGVLGVLHNFFSSHDRDCIVLDYGCAHGHYTINLAKQFPETRFIGVDIAASNIEKARKWAKEAGIKNVEFWVGQIREDGLLHFKSNEEEEEVIYGGDLFQVTLAAEIIEHVADPFRIVNALRLLTDTGGKVILTTPYGGWEAVGYKEHWPWRAHVHHFDREYINNVYRGLEGFKLSTAPSGRGIRGEPIGSYIYSFNPSHGVVLEDYKTDVSTISTRQTLSLCMIVKDGAADILRCLTSVKDIIDEVVIGIDKNTSDNSEEIITNFCKKEHIPHLVFDIEPALKTGFDTARNFTIEKASGQWILWVDADEVLHNPKNINKYLRNNQYTGYAIKQHHIAVEPLGVLKTDMPCRLFRNGKGIKFFGVVHEHPELELNEGIGHVTLIQDACIEHHGYPTEDARRKRFSRNIELMARDREKHPSRTLGKFLWIRDLAQMNTYELEMNGNVVTDSMLSRASEGIRLWEELMEGDNVRMLTDGIQFYSSLVSVTGQGFDFSFVVKGSKFNGGADLGQAAPVSGRFLNDKHLAMFMSKFTEQEIKNYDSRYF